MTPIEEELRAVFVRHEAMTPAAGPVRAKIDKAWVRAKRRRLMRRIAGASAALLMAGAAVPPVVEQWQQRMGPVVPMLGNGILVDSPAPAGPLDVLLLGSDNRLRSQNPRDRRADTVMVIHIPADRSRIFLVSLPRDGEVRLSDGARVKLSETLFFGGPALTEQVVTGLTGITFDATVTLDFRALRAVTAAVGGVEMCLAQTIKSLHNGRKYPKGCQHLAADDIAPVLQARVGLQNGGYDRDRNTQRFLGALATKLAADGTLTDPARVHALLMAARTGMEIDGDSGALLRAAMALDQAPVVGVGERSFQSLGNGRERIYPRVGPDLYAAIRADTLADWTSANPSYVTE